MEHRPRLNPSEYGLVRGTGRRMLVIPDLHAPFIRKMYFEFVCHIADKYNTNDVMFLGDLLDNHFSSYHEADPDGHSAGAELDKAMTDIARWYNQFPEARVCIGNHDSIPQRKMMTAGLSAKWLKPISEVLDVPNWEFAEEWVVDGVKYCHGTTRKARNRAKDDLMSVVEAHYHSESYIDHFVGENYKIFALQLGCGIDRTAYSMAYGRNFKKMHINVGVVLEDGTLPIIEYMDL